MCIINQLDFIIIFTFDNFFTFQNHKIRQYSFKLLIIRIK